MTKVWMPIYWGDYLRDTMHLATVEHGAYLLLIAHYWTSRTPLPDNDARLAAITKLSPDAWSNARPVLAAFFKIADGVWRHERVEKELAAWSERKEKRSQKAKTAAEARWGARGDAPGNPRGNAPSTPQEMLGSCPSSPSSSSSMGSLPSPPAQDAARAHEGGAAEEWTDAEIADGRKIIAAFDESRVRVWGPELARLCPHPKDLVTAIRWLRAGARLALIAETLAAVHRKLHADGVTGAGVPNTLGYHSNDIATAIQAGRAPTVVTGGRAGPDLDGAKQRASERAKRVLGGAT